MSKLISPYPHISVYKDKNGKIIARTKPGPNKKIKTHPQYQRVREQGAVFGKASSHGKTIRRIFHPWAKNTADSYLSARLATQLMSIMNSAVHQNRMEPMLTNGDISKLEGFQFNPKAGLHSAFFGSYSVSCENDNRRIDILVPAFIPAQAIYNPNGNFSHFRLVPLVAVINFNTGEHMLLEEEKGNPVACNDKTYKHTHLQTNIILPGEVVIIIALGIEFYCAVGEKQYTPVAAGGHNALGILKVVKACVP